MIEFEFFLGFILLVIIISQILFDGLKQEKVK